MDGGVEGRGSAGRTGKMGRGDAHHREGRIEADKGHVPIHPQAVGMCLMFHDWGVAPAHPHGLIEVECIGGIDRCGWLGELEGCLWEILVLWGVRRVCELIMVLKGETR